MTSRGDPPIRLIAFDVDGTLVHHDEQKTVWQVLNGRYLARPGLNRERFEAFRDKRITYAEWVDLDIGDWVTRDVRRADLAQAIQEELTCAPGALETIASLSQRGYRLLVISGTLNLTLELLLPNAPFEHVFSNRIWFHPDGKIRAWRATPFDVTGKAVALKSLSRAYGLTERNCAFIGDGWNDISALRCAGLGIAFHPKEDAVAQAADVSIATGSLTQLLDLFPGAT